MIPLGVSSDRIHVTLLHFVPKFFHWISQIEKIFLMFFTRKMLHASKVSSLLHCVPYRFYSDGVLLLSHLSQQSLQRRAPARGCVYILASSWFH